jgi:hypothetical protein
VAVVNEVELPGIGVRYEFVTEGGARVGVVHHRTGQPRDAHHPRPLVVEDLVMAGYLPFVTVLLVGGGWRAS